MTHSITLADYLMGRDTVPLTNEQYLTAVSTVEKVNHLLGLLAGDGVDLEINPRTGSLVSSGYRPQNINANTPGAAPKSRHITLQACDLYDPEGEIDNWCMENLSVLEQIGLWMEHPSATKGWCHIQTVPPRSRRRVFYP